MGFQSLPVPALRQADAQPAILNIGVHLATTIANADAAILGFYWVVERLWPVGLLDGKSCALPITQMDLADATGLSVVHLNRTLQELRGSGLIILRDRTLTIDDLDALKNVGLFDGSYLHYSR